MLAFAFITGPVEFASPTWSADGRWIAFVSNLDGHWKIYAASPETLELRKLGRRHPVTSVTWSPEGSQLAYVCACEDGSELVLLDTGSLEEQTIGESIVPAEQAQVVYRQDARQIAVRVEATEQTGGSRILVHELTRLGGTATIDHPAQVQSLAFLNNDLVLAGNLDGSAQLWRLDLGEGNFSRLLAMDGWQSRRARPSPDQKQIIIERAPDGRDDWELALLDTEKGELRRITASAGTNTAAAWDPSGERIAFVTTRRGYRELMILDLRTDQKTYFSAAILGGFSGRSPSAPE